MVTYSLSLSNHSLISVLNFSVCCYKLKLFSITVDDHGSSSTRNHSTSHSGKRVSTSYLTIILVIHSSFVMKAQSTRFSTRVGNQPQSRKKTIITLCKRPNGASPLFILIFVVSNIFYFTEGIWHNYLY